MANNILGTLIGAAIDRKDGDSGLKGAVGGYLVEGAIKKVIPVALTFTVGWFVLKGARRGLQAVRNSVAGGSQPPVDGPAAG